MIKRSGKKNLILTLVVSALLIIAVATGITIAALTDQIKVPGSTTVVGNVNIGLYSGGGATLISGTTGPSGEYTPTLPTSVTLSNATTNNVNVYVKNTGNVSALVRVTLALYIPDSGTGLLNLLDQTQLTLQNNGWVNSFYEITGESEGSRTLHFVAYYNQKLNPNVPLQVITKLAPKTGMLGQTVQITFVAEAVSHSGNAYLLESQGKTVTNENKPFGNLSSAFLAEWTAWQ